MTGSCAVDSLTRLILVNAIWFQANWANQFDPDRTDDGQFNLLDGSQTSVPFMHSETKTQFAETDDFTAVRLPYAGDAAMVLALPRGDLSQLVAKLEPAHLDLDWGESMVDLAVPKFTFESELSLSDSLKSLGMDTAFAQPNGDSGADFTGITERRELYLLDAFHSSFVAVDEFGTEAAAATALVISTTSAAPPATLHLDRPFLFWIEHTPTGTPLFLGQVTNPAS